MIITYSILEEFLSQKFHSLESIRVDDYSFLGEGDLRVIHIVFRLFRIYLNNENFPNGVDYSDNFGEDILLSDFQDWVLRRRSDRLGDLGI